MKNTNQCCGLCTCVRKGPCSVGNGTQPSLTKQCPPPVTGDAFPPPWPLLAAMVVGDGGNYDPVYVVDIKMKKATVQGF